MNKMPSTPAPVAHTPLSDAEIASLAHTLFLYCTARTDNEADAEDLCGEIWLALYESLPHLREDAAFYGFFSKKAACAPRGSVRYARGGTG